MRLAIRNLRYIHGKFFSVKLTALGQDISDSDLRKALTNAVHGDLYQEDR